MRINNIDIVWLKRDLRTQDHAPLFQAEQEGNNYLIIYIYEPELIQYPDSSLRHHQFIFHSILNMNDKLKRFNRVVDIFYGSSIEVFTYLHQNYTIRKVYSYQESGIELSWLRDKQLSSYFRTNKIDWQEFQRDGVIRGIKNRINWDKNWYAYAHSKIIENQLSISSLENINNPFSLQAKFLNGLKKYPELFQKAGENYAWKYLSSFCDERGKNYSKHISKPTESRKSCGRISPYLAWGNISIRQAYQYVKSHVNYPENKRSFNGMLTRLKWHCHFIQKFEVECEYETRCINKGYNTLKYSNNPVLIEQWKSGTTGFPLVDACMRCLKETGWINFRMRAMLVSVFCHHFDCDWKEGVYHLAQLFLDYEPGIHYPQFQMQAGTTGINTIRMYNPVKQSYDHDKDGVFIKKWIPELRDVPSNFIHEPWKITEMDKALLGFNLNYPIPMIDIAKSGEKARKKIWGHRKDPKVKSENQRILALHTRNDSKRRE